MKNIAIFASGNGSNAENIINYFKNSPNIKINLVLTNNAKAFVLERIKPYNVTGFVFSGKELRTTGNVLIKLDEYNIDFIVLAGFLLMVPENILNKYPNKIINIHPALLPKFGGKGMYGMHVHQAVIESGEKESGITIHYVNEKYDDGAIIFQAKCTVSPIDTPETLAGKIHVLEQTYFPEVIKKTLSSSK
jgi:phosphoribosylglycinamide formyltransferase-1